MTVPKGSVTETVDVVCDGPRFDGFRLVTWAAAKGLQVDFVSRPVVVRMVLMRNGMSGSTR